MGDKTGAGVCRASRQRAFDRADDAPPVKCGSEGVRVPRCHARFDANFGDDSRVQHARARNLLTSAGEHRKKNQPDFHFVVMGLGLRYSPATRAQTDRRRI